MRTRLHSLPDWRKELETIGWSDAPDAAAVQQSVVRELTRGRVSFEPQAPGLPIENGCRVTLETHSRLPKFNRDKTVLTVGAGLYDTAVEALLPGMSEGRSAETLVRGEKVEFRVLKVERKVYPQLCDEMAAAQQLEGIETLEQYEKYMRDKLRRSYAEELCSRLLEISIPLCSMDSPDPMDVRDVIDREFEPLRARFSYGETDLDTMSPEEWKASLYNPELQKYYEQIYPDVALLMGTTSKDSFYESRRAAAEETIRCCLVLRAILNDTADAHDPTLALNARQELTQELVDRLLPVIYGKG